MAILIIAFIASIMAFSFTAVLALLFIEKINKPGVTDMPKRKNLFQSNGYINFPPWIFIRRCFFKIRPLRVLLLMTTAGMLTSCAATNKRHSQRIHPKGYWTIKDFHKPGDKNKMTAHDQEKQPDTVQLTN